MDLYFLINNRGPTLLIAVMNVGIAEEIRGIGERGVARGRKEGSFDARIHEINENINLIV